MKRTIEKEREREKEMMKEIVKTKVTILVVGKNAVDYKQTNQ
jgi:hypothetical protein